MFLQLTGLLYQHEIFKETPRVVTKRPSAPVIPLKFSLVEVPSNRGALPSHAHGWSPIWVILVIVSAGIRKAWATRCQGTTRQDLDSPTSELQVDTGSEQQRWQKTFGNELMAIVQQIIQQVPLQGAKHPNKLWKQKVRTRQKTWNFISLLARQVFI